MARPKKQIFEEVNDTKIINDKDLIVIDKPLNKKSKEVNKFKVTRNIKIEQVKEGNINKTSSKISNYIDIWKKNKGVDFIEKIMKSANNRPIMVFVPNFGKMKALCKEIDEEVYVDGFLINRKYPVEVLETPYIKLCIIAKLLGYSRLSWKVQTKIKKYKRVLQ